MNLNIHSISGNRYETLGSVDEVKHTPIKKEKTNNIAQKCIKEEPIDFDDNDVQLDCKPEDASLENKEFIRKCMSSSIAFNWIKQDVLTSNFKIECKYEDSFSNEGQEFLSESSSQSSSKCKNLKELSRSVLNDESSPTDSDENCQELLVDNELNSDFQDITEIKNFGSFEKLTTFNKSMKLNKKKSKNCKQSVESLSGFKRVKRDIKKW